LLSYGNATKKNVTAVIVWFFFLERSTMLQAEIMEAKFARNCFTKEQRIYIAPECFSEHPSWWRTGLLPMHSTQKLE